MNATPTNIGAADFLLGGPGNDVIYGETGNDAIYGNGQNDQLYGNSGSDWISGGAGNDGILGDDGLLLVARNGIAEPLYGLAATTQLVLGTGDGSADNLLAVVNVTGEINYTAIEQPFFVGAPDIVYGGLGNDFLHGGQGNDAMSGAEALPLYYDSGLDPLAVVARYYGTSNVLAYDQSSQLFGWFDPAHPFQKIMVAPGVDFLLNFVSATDFGATTPQPVVDDGRDVLFGDGGNDWLVGGTNSDVLFGGWGNDVLQADDNLDSTRVDIPVTTDSLCSLVGSYSSDSHTTSDLCHDLSHIQSSADSWHGPDVSTQIDDWAEQVTRAIGDAFTADQAATLIRLAQALKPSYDPLANNTVDPRGTGPSNADIAYGGAGHDILIANTASDRLIDWQRDVNAFYVPWEGDAGHTLITAGAPDDVTQFLFDLGLALGADPTRPEVASPPWGHGDPATYQNGEPFGELGLIQPSDENWYEHDQWGPHGWWPDDTNPSLHPEGAPDLGSLGVSVPLTPSAQPQLIDSLHVEVPHDGHLDEAAQALLHRIVVRGQLTTAETAALSSENAEALQDLLEAGLVAAAGDGYAATDATWLALGLANPPRIDGLDRHATTTESAGVTLTGTGDAGDTITVYAGTVALGATLVAADGTWQLTVYPPVGEQCLTATQTVNELPHVGLTSGQSDGVAITVLPDAPRISTVSTPGPATPTAPVTLTGTGDAGDTVALYDGGRWIAGTVVAADGTWTLTVSLAPGTHALAETQSTPCSGHHCDSLTSPVSGARTVTVYAPPSAPVINAPSPANVVASFTLSGRGTAGDTVNIYDAGSVLVGTATVAANGTWSLLLSLPLGPHTLRATQTDPVSTFTGAAGNSVSVTVYTTPPAPAIGSVSTPAATMSTTPVTVTGTGVAGDTITLFDGATVRGTAVVAVDGTWTLTIQLGVGVHTLTATQTVAPGVTGPAGAAVSVTVLPPPPAAPTLSAPALVPLAPLALGGHGVAGDTVTVYDGAAAIGTTTVAGNGSWSLTVSLALGAHSLAARQTDPVWNLTSVLGAAVTVTVVPTPPPPAIVSAVAGHAHGWATPVTVGGTGVAGETVTLYDGGTAIGTVTVAADGTWALTVYLGNGSHTFTATQALAAGPASDPSAAFTLQLGGHWFWW